MSAFSAAMRLRTRYAVPFLSCAADKAVSLTVVSNMSTCADPALLIATVLKMHSKFYGCYCQVKICWVALEAAYSLIETSH